MNKHLAPRHSFNAHKGATLIEVLLFIVIVSVAMVGMLVMFDYAVKNSADPLVRKQAILIAEAMLDEILAKNFSPTSYVGSNRAEYDDVSDYNGFSMPVIKALDGSAISGLSNYNVSVAVNSTTAVLGSIPVSKVKSVTVTVTSGSETITLVGYRTSYD